MATRDMVLAATFSLTLLLGTGAAMNAAQQVNATICLGKLYLIHTQTTTGDRGFNHSHAFRVCGNGGLTLPYWKLRNTTCGHVFYSKVSQYAFNNAAFFFYEQGFQFLTNAAHAQRGSFIPYALTDRFKANNAQALICQDPDKCLFDLHSCPPHSTCNSLGDGTRYNCTCDAGFSGSARTCSDVDECASGMHNCSDNAACINTAGSYHCECLPGFFGTGTRCIGNPFYCTPDVAVQNGVFPKTGFVGSHADVTCSSGLIEVTKQSLCQVNQSWSVLPRCDYGCSGKALGSGVMGKLQVGYAVNTAVNLSCGSGYFLTDSDSLLCEQDPAGIIDWTGSQRCTATCNITQIAAGSVKNVRSEYQPGSTLEIACQSGLYSFGLPYVCTLNQTANTASWKGSQQCLRGCALQRIVNGQVANNQEYFANGSQATVKCNPGYHLVGELPLKCFVAGRSGYPGAALSSWTGNHRCISGCLNETVPKVPNATIENTHQHYTHGTTLVVSCNPGFYADGEPFVCTQDSGDSAPSWNGSLVCRPNQDRDGESASQASRSLAGIIAGSIVGCVALATSVAVTIVYPRARKMQLHKRGSDHALAKYTREKEGTTVETLYVAPLIDDNVRSHCYGDISVDNKIEEGSTYANESTVGEAERASHCDSNSKKEAEAHTVSVCGNETAVELESNGNHWLRCEDEDADVGTARVYSNMSAGEAEDQCVNPGEELYSMPANASCSTPVKEAAKTDTDYIAPREDRATTTQRQFSDCQEEVYTGIEIDMTGNYGTVKDELHLESFEEAKMDDWE